MLSKTVYKNHKLVYNPKYPLETCHTVVDEWKGELRDETLAIRLPNVTKRLFIEDRLFEAGGETFRAKFYRTVGLKRRFEAMFIHAESIRNFRTSLRVAEVGLLTHEPLCVWGAWVMGVHRWSVMFMKDVGELTPLPQFLDNLNPATHERKLDIALALAKDLAKLHDAGVFVYDPSKNVLVKETPEGVRFVFIDFDTVRGFLPLTKKQVARVLRHCIRPPKNLEMYDPSEREAYIRAYLDARGLSHWFDKIFPIV